MSVIVFDGHTLATDSFANNGHLAFPLPKVWEVHSNGNTATLGGAVGPLQAVAQLRQWTLDGCQPQTLCVPEGSQLVLVSKEKGLVRYNGSPIPILHGFNKIAIGEGAPFAYGALDALENVQYKGNDAAVIAVEAAIKYSPHCNGEPVYISL